MQLFNKCLEPDADDEVSGCDNMTAIIVQFKQNQPGTQVLTASKNTKRPSTPTFISTDNEVHKKFKTDD